MSLQSQITKYTPLFFQLTRFGIVGITAAAVNYIIVIAAVEYGELNPLVANFIAFIFAFQVSYWGHRLWTFDTDTDHKTALPRFLTTALLTLLANEALFSLLLFYFNLHYQPALLIVLITLPLFTFIINKYWVFK